MVLKKTIFVFIFIIYFLKEKEERKKEKEVSKRSIGGQKKKADVEVAGGTWPV